jgi:radical SAM superfamily enzyme YgiQ (UPF0313 family)
MTMNVTFVELSAFEGILPLASGYLQAYAQSDPEISGRCSFEIYSEPVDSDRETVVNELLGRDSDVYALSCYIWNMRYVEWVLDRLYEAHPDARFILGGPQVMNHIADYVPAARENVVVCDGEGERTFAEYLKHVLGCGTDLTEVPGLSFWQGGEVRTNQPVERIKDLMEIPSPFTTGVFEEGKYTTAILETNRGCPFHCGFCAWGNATNDKVHKFETERAKDDIEWICANKFVAIFIADANWGIGPRDVELTEHIVKCSDKYGYPYMVAMAAAKNKPDRMAVITETLVSGGLLTSQPISLQTRDTQTLDIVRRSNIRPETYTELQRTLREKRISSYIELIWPLPGETLDSYQHGIADLCRSRADTIIVYPQLLLHNTPIYNTRDVLGIKTAPVPNDVAEANVVVETKWVNREEYETGAWFSYAMHSLYNVRGLYYLSNYLDRTGTATFAEIYANAVRYFRESESPITRYFAESVATLRNYDFHDSGMIAHIVLHSDRTEFDQLLDGFARTQSWWSDPGARAAFELDLVARPYIYLEKAQVPNHEFTDIECEQVDRYSFAVTLPDTVAGLLADLDMPTSKERTPNRVTVSHSPRRKMPHMPSRSVAHNASYCQGMILRLRDYLPSFTVS